MTLVLRVALSLAMTFSLAMWQSGGCGYTPDPLAGEGEPCTRTSECQSALTCRGGVCMAEAFDAGEPPDAGVFDSGTSDSGMDSGADGGDAATDGGDAAVDLDASMDGALPEAGAGDGGDGGDGGDAGDASLDAG